MLNRLVCSTGGFCPQVILQGDFGSTDPLRWFYPFLNQNCQCHPREQKLHTWTTSHSLFSSKNMKRIGMLLMMFNTSLISRGWSCKMGRRIEHHWPHVYVDTLTESTSTRLSPTYFFCKSEWPRVFGGQKGYLHLGSRPPDCSCLTDRKSSWLSSGSLQTAPLVASKKTSLPNPV